MLGFTSAAILLRVSHTVHRITGPMSERGICIVLMAFQFVCCCFGLFLRHYVASAIYQEGTGGGPQ